MSERYHLAHLGAESMDGRPKSATELRITQRGAGLLFSARRTNPKELPP